jgi:hypothetical protein
MKMMLSMLKRYKNNVIYVKRYKNDGFHELF